MLNIIENSTMKISNQAVPYLTVSCLQGPSRKAQVTNRPHKERATSPDALRRTPTEGAQMRSKIGVAPPVMAGSLTKSLFEREKHDRLENRLKYRPSLF
jgi:hypothetical protein